LKYNFLQKQKMTLKILHKAKNENPSLYFFEICRDVPLYLGLSTILVSPDYDTGETSIRRT